MNDLQLSRHNVEITIDECEKHVMRIRRAAGLLTSFPLDEKSYARLTEDEIAHIDQLSNPR